jgi:uncharacterized membrane protein YedE/YeeE
MSWREPDVAGKSKPALHSIPFASGLLFGLGLVVSGMTDPSRVRAFLDVAGAWNPAVAFVMGGAIAVTLPAFAWVRRGGATLAGSVPLPDRMNITPRLIVGSATFGVGWGLSGVCPGPGIVIATSGTWQTALFLLSMIAGIWVYALGSRYWMPAAPSGQAHLRSEAGITGK